MRLALGMCLVVACGAPQVAPPPPHGDAAALVAKADAALAKSFELDDRAPAADPRGDLQREAVSLYAQACDLGDARACWLAVTYEKDSAKRVPWTRAILKHCDAGDATSCRFLRSSKDRAFGDWGFAAASCTAGIGLACSIGAGQLDNYQALLERGCKLGDVDSCFELERDKPGDTSPAVLASYRADCERGYPTHCLPDQQEKMLALAEQGCRDGLVDECEMVAYPLGLHAQTPPELRTEARDHGFEHLCHQLGTHCFDLSMFHRPATKTLPGPLPDPAAERDAMEHACQLRREVDACEDLDTAYANHDLAEPRPGRAREVHDWVCAKEPKRGTCTP